MDFSPTPAQDDLSALTGRILTDLVTQERLRQVEASQERLDRDLWSELARAGVLSAALPEAAGGAGFGLLEQCSVLIEIGRAVAPVPYLASIVLGAATVAEFGSTAQLARWAEPAARGSVLLAAALAEDDSEDPSAPATTAHRSDGGWRLTGTKTSVLAGTAADVLLVPASTPSGVVVFLVTPGDPGVAVRPQHVTGGDATALVELAGAVLPDDSVLGSVAAGRDIAAWLAARATVGLCALQLGVTERALELTAAYARSREQFGKPIGSFQAVSQRLADGYIDVEGIRLTLWQAAWRLAAGLPAVTEVATAKFWAADGGHRVAHTAVHVHGGVGIDVEGAVHRYFAAAVHNEFALGGATAQLRRIGRALAAD
ncbi:MAG TPA: acyl-CoA dehydrogenase family protein [Streptosporangiaceae bacterium]|nr:acyl-CoA dehydrogenase family protein [Streptosporangiaceae bacterium]